MTLAACFNFVWKWPSQYRKQTKDDVESELDSIKKKIKRTVDFNVI